MNPKTIGIQSYQSPCMQPPDEGPRIRGEGLTAALRCRLRRLEVETRQEIEVCPTCSIPTAVLEEEQGRHYCHFCEKYLDEMEL